MEDGIYFVDEFVVVFHVNCQYETSVVIDMLRQVLKDGFQEKLLSKAKGFD